MSKLTEARTPSDTLRAVADHAQKVISTRSAERDRRVDIAIPPELAGRLGDDTTARYEALIGCALAALDLVSTRRQRDLHIARGRPDKAQPYGAQIAVAETTIEDLVATIVGGKTEDNQDAPMSADVAKRSRNGLRGDPERVPRQLQNARVRVALAVLRELIAAGEENYSRMAKTLNERGLPAPRGGDWIGATVTPILKRAGLYVDGGKGGRPRPADPPRAVRARTRPPQPAASAHV